MALNADFIGRTYPPSPVYAVGREKVREFAFAVGERSPICHDVDAARSAGYADVVAPATFAFVIAMKAMAAATFDPDLGLDYSRVVHGEQRFAYARPIVAGDELVATAVIEDIREVAGNDLLTTRVDLATTTGEHVVSTFSVIVSRGQDAS
jgi:acyl dehydratase